MEISSGHDVKKFQVIMVVNTYSNNSMSTSQNYFGNLKPVNFVPHALNKSPVHFFGQSLRLRIF